MDFASWSRIPRLVAVLALTIVAGFALTACGTTTSGGESAAQSQDRGSGSSQPADGEPLKVAILHNNPANDAAWGATWRAGAEQLEEHFGDKVQVTAKYSVPEAQTESTVRSLIQDGHKVIVGTTFAHQTATLKLAPQHPDVTFLQLTAAETLPNLASVDFLGADGYYVAGMAAAAASKGGPLGVVGAFPIPSNLSMVNAFQFGAQQIDPSIKTKVVWTNDWGDDSKGQSASRALANSGAGALTTFMTGPAVLAPVAKSGDLPWVSLNTDQSRYAPEQYLTGVVLDWGPYLIEQVQAIMDDKWKTGTYVLTMENGGVKLAPWGRAFDRVSESDRAEIEEALKGMQDGSLHALTGPVKDQSGNVKIPEGKYPDYAQIATTDYLAEGVEGKIPEAP